MTVYPRALQSIVDEDGRGFVLQGMQKSAIFNNKDVRDIVLQTVRPNKWRGGHYHERKTEWFLPLRGSAVLSWYDIDAWNPKEKTEVMIADMQNPKIFEIQPKTCHFVENNSEEDFYMLAISSEDFDPDDNLKCSKPHHPQVTNGKILD